MAGDVQAGDTGLVPVADERKAFTERDLGTLPRMIGAAARTAATYEQSRAVAQAANERLEQAEKDNHAAEELMNSAQLAYQTAHGAVFEEFARLLPRANETPEGRKVLADKWLRIRRGQTQVDYSGEVWHSHESRADLATFGALQDPATSLVVDASIDLGRSGVGNGALLETPGDLELYSNRKHEVVELSVLIPVEEANLVPVPLDDLCNRLVVGKANIKKYFLNEFEPTEPDNEQIRQSASWASGTIADNVRYREAIETLGIGEELADTVAAINEANMRTASRALGLDRDKKRAMRVDLGFGQSRDAFVNALVDADIFDNVLIEIAKKIEEDESREVELVDFVARALSDDRSAKPSTKALAEAKTHLEGLIARADETAAQ